MQSVFPGLGESVFFLLPQHCLSGTSRLTIFLASPIVRVTSMGFPASGFIASNPSSTVEAVTVTESNHGSDTELVTGDTEVKETQILSSRRPWSGGGDRLGQMVAARCLLCCNSAELS